MTGPDPSAESLLEHPARLRREVAPRRDVWDYLGRRVEAAGG